LPEEGRYTLQAENMGENAAPMLLTQNEFMRRYKEMSALGGGLNFYGEMPDSYTIKLNVENPLVKKVIAEKDSATEEKANDLRAQIANVKDALDLIDKDTRNKKDEDIPQEMKDKREKLNSTLTDLQNQKRDLMKDFGRSNTLLKQIADLALLANGMLKGKQLSDFVSRSLDLLK
ncbi:MAG: molecular chaperone HtpG, partial [Bacteroidales bacterium]|nr:molecular chaperone HtpG [Bacteroidales bacterium]